MAWSAIGMSSTATECHSVTVKQQNSTLIQTPLRVNLFSRLCSQLWNHKLLTTAERRWWFHLIGRYWLVNYVDTPVEIPIAVFLNYYAPKFDSDPTNVRIHVKNYTRNIDSSSVFGVLITSIHPYLQRITIQHIYKLSNCG